MRAPGRGSDAARPVAMVVAVRKRPPLSQPTPLLTPSRRRRRTYVRRRVTALVTLVCLLAAGAIALTRGGGSSAPASATVRHARVPDPRRARARSHPGHSTDTAYRQQVQAIMSVLKYTPFIRAGTPRHRVIALTFDDGPSPYTVPIINVLTRMRVPGTFFVVGQQLNDFSSALRAEVAHRFVIGDHTENHAWMIRLPAAGQFQQVHDAEVREERLGAPVPHLFRPPYGAYNAQTLKTLHQLGMLMVLWSVDPGDWRRPGTAAIIHNVLANATPGGIVLLHDGGGDRSQTVAALPAIIDGLHRMHYQLVTVPRLLKLDPPPHGQRLPQLYGV